jgi:hypothetical protein
MKWFRKCTESYDALPTQDVEGASTPVLPLPLKPVQIRSEIDTDVEEDKLNNVSNVQEEEDEHPALEKHSLLRRATAPAIPEPHTYAGKLEKVHF